MGILNVTPDSFSDGGRHLAFDAAVARAEQMAAEGAQILDVGGESTRPGAEPVPPEEELARVVPVVRALAGRLSVPISVDTSRAGVARAALAEGAVMVNDVSGGRRDPELLRVVAAARAHLVVMHSRGTPADMAGRAVYGHVVLEVARELAAAVATAVDAGVDPSRILVDPGLGFAKTAEQNVELLAHLPALASMGFPLVLGASRKAFIGRLTGRDRPDERVSGSIAAALAAAAAGAAVVRVHDVGPTREALAVARAIALAGE